MGLAEMRARARRRATERAPEEAKPSSSRVSAALDRAFSAMPNTGTSSGFVRNTDEVNRIAALPRVVWNQRTDIDDLIDLLTGEYSLPLGSMRLRPVQAVTLESLADNSGAFGLIGVGEGKTLISYLAPLVVNAQRPLLIVPAKLKEKTIIEFRDLAEHWQPVDIEVISYEWLSRVGAADFLDEFQPDLIVADEAHKLKNPSASVTRRVVRYLRDTGETFLPMSGTIANRSLMDFHHLLALSVGIKTMPLPAPAAECKVWAQAVDEKVKNRARAGALRFLLDDEKEKPSLKNLRNAVGRRIHQTFGVVNTQKKSVDASIIVTTFSPKMDPRIDQYIRNLITARVTPIGEEALPADVHRHIRTLVSGFFYRWDPAPPQPWSKARSWWKSYARDILEQEDERFDSELQVANGVDRGDLNDGGALDSWRGIRDSFKPNSVPVWVTDAPLREVLKRDTGNTIFWVEHIATGKKLAEMSGLPYYHRLGIADEGDFIGDHKSGSFIASIASNAEGRNLQHYSHNVIVTPPASGRTVEQLMGRTHRPGQMADEVGFEIMTGHNAIVGHLQQAIKDAEFIHLTTGQPQKLLIADISL